MMECVASCLELLAPDGYQAFDPQLRRVVTAADLSAMISRYESMNVMLPEILASTGSRAKKPWWKFW